MTESREDLVDTGYVAPEASWNSHFVQRLREARTGRRGRGRRRGPRRARPPIRTPSCWSWRRPMDLARPDDRRPPDLHVAGPAQHQTTRLMVPLQGANRL